MKRNIKCNFGTDSEEFEHYVGRKPTKQDMDDWVSLLEKGVEAQLDWETINQEAAEEVR